MNFKEIQDLIRLVKKNNISELKIEQDDFKIVLRSQDDEEKVVQQYVQQQAPIAPAPTPAPAPVQNTAPQQPVVTPEPVASPAPSHLVEIKSTMIGTFYRSPGPDKDPFLSIGDTIKPGDTICMIEAMKLFNEIESEVSGKVVEILVEDATPVEFDTPLFLIDPKA